MRRLLTHYAFLVNELSPFRRCQHANHLDGGLGGETAGVAVTSAGAVQCLLLGVGRQHAKDHRYALIHRDLLAPAGRLAGDVVEMRRIATNDRAATRWVVASALAVTGSSNAPGTR